MSSSRPLASLAKQRALRRELENCHLVAGIYCTGLSIRQLKELRGSLPETSRLVVAKNSLMEKAVEGTRWEPLKFCAKGMNAWLFVHDDDNVPRALKPYRDLQKKWGRRLQRLPRGGLRGEGLRGGGLPGARDDADQVGGLQLSARLHAGPRGDSCRDLAGEGQARRCGHGGGGFICLVELDSKGTAVEGGRETECSFCLEDYLLSYLNFALFVCQNSISE
ncbi:50S ribosomal protein L10, chloroplastic [Iris pallida]|uniref:50S ribosomal protein L10, chloroplastic n=1 Tax=Iris pallida TaxID=29817 RepID=A0AAX6GKQ8_IRIPA|nr:50S ribosomal protein L10, chloroplastic [Iris pallida]